MSDIGRKSIIVTGASSGFGYQIARRFLSEGRRVVAVARREERLKELVNEFGDLVYIDVVDVRDLSAIEKHLDDLPEDFKDIHCLVNNAGLSLGFGPAQLNSIDDWKTIVDTNINGLLYYTHCVLKILSEKNSGHIINIGSIAAYYPYIGGNVYAASKAFVNNFSLNLKSDLSNTKIRVSCIAPGMSKTEFALVRFKGDEVLANDLYEDSDYLLAEDIAEAVYWVYSLPASVNVNVLELIPTGQSFSLGFNDKKKNVVSAQESEIEIA